MRNYCTNFWSGPWIPGGMLWEISKYIPGENKKRIPGKIFGCLPKQELSVDKERSQLITVGASSVPVGT